MPGVHAAKKYRIEEGDEGESPLNPSRWPINKPYLMGRRARSCVEVMLITEHIRGFEPRVELELHAQLQPRSRRKFNPYENSFRVCFPIDRLPPRGGRELEFRGLCSVDHKRNVCHGITSDDRVARGSGEGGLGGTGESTTASPPSDVLVLGIYCLSLLPRVLFHLNFMILPAQNRLFCSIFNRPVSGRERSFTAHSS